MKLITAVIKSMKLEEVLDALTRLGVTGVTVMEVKGTGKLSGSTSLYHGGDQSVSFLPKLKIELAVSADMADRVVDAIINAAQTGRAGDGKIFVLDLEEVVRIRTRETGADAL